jgi:hypothetical protein
LVDTLEEGRLRHILGRGYGQGLAIQQAVVSETDVGPSSVDVALCARALSVAYRVLAIDDPLQANPRGVKLWEWESRALGLEHFAEFVRVEIARGEGRTTNYVSAKSYYNAAVLTRSALGIQVRLTPHSTKDTTPAAGEIKHGRTDQRLSKLPWAASVPTTKKPQERSEKAGASHKAQPFDILSDVGPAYACFGNSEDLESQPAARQQEPQPDSPEIRLHLTGN